MELLKKIWNKLNNPKWYFLALVYLLAIIFCAISITSLVVDIVNPILLVLSYLSYGGAVIFLSYSIYTIVKLGPTVKNEVMELVNKNSFTNKLAKQYGFRTLFTTSGSTIFGLANIIFYTTFALIEHSIWYGSLAGYYTLLVIMRSIVLLYHRRKAKNEVNNDLLDKLSQNRIYKWIGLGLIILPMFLSLAIAQMVLGNNSFEHSGILIYVSALYAFYKIIMGIYNTRKAHKNNEYTIRAARNINLADALVSMLALETAMFKEFSPEMDVSAPIAITGAIVSILTCLIGLFVFINGNKREKILKAELKN